MTTETIDVEADERGLLTVAALLKQIPPSWHDAEICVKDGYRVGEIRPVRRVSLHYDDTGRRVVVLCASRINVTE